ncbi:MAG: SpoIIE family protein phosphatase [Spirochaetes bacterium]|nr:SpoIIE family protein phosphatase [Spirochaetota bacterium]
MEYLEDAGGTLTFDNIKSEKYQSHWKQSKKEDLGFGFTKSVYWARFTLENISDRDVAFYLEEADAIMWNIRLYAPGGNGYKMIEAGLRKPFRERPVSNRTFVFPLEVKSKTRATFYARFYTQDAMNLHLRIWSPEAFKEKTSIEYHLLLLFDGIIIILILYNLIVFFFIRRFEYLYYVFFVFFTLMFFSTHTGTSFQYLWPDSPWWSAYSTPFFLNLMLAFICLFVTQLVDLKSLSKKKLYLKITYYTLMVFAILFILLSLFTLVSTYLYIIIVSAALTIITLSYIAVMGVILILKEKSRPALMGMIAASFVIISAVVYALKQFGVLPANFFTQWTVHFGIVIMVVLFSISLADRLNIMRRDLQASRDALLDMNRNLEKKVVDRTELLQSSMEELSAVNLKLAEAHRRALIDMSMAANIQSTLFPKAPPDTGEWDVAYLFRPMSGVSGDLYDFYEENGRLTGIALFDVSGHGIASGLITMIARTVFHRNFMKGTNKELNSILEKSNMELINEIGMIENYLTGLLLRFSGDTVEYVNAAHPDVLVRRAGSGDIEIANLKGSDFKGYFIGIAGLEREYETLKFNIGSNDVLLLYTDCLEEGRNKKEERYGEERIFHMLKKAPGGTAGEVLDFIMGDFFSFTAGRDPEDDLTVIVLKKK